MQLVLNGAVAQQHRQQRHDRGGGGQHDGADAAPRLVAREPDRPQADKWNRVEEVIPARQPLQGPARREQAEPSELVLTDIAMERDERQRQPEYRQQFEMRDVGASKGIEAEDQSADGARGMAARQHPRQRVGRERAQHERGKQGDVVGQHRRAAHPLDRAGKKRQADAVIGERQAAGRGEEAEAVPPRTQKGEPVHVPPERPRAEKWIPKVVWHRSGELSKQVAEKQQDEPHIPEEGNTKAPGRGGACSGAHDRGVMILNVLACRLPRSHVVRKS